ncbi:hypothetical protein WR25_24910 [Diploscapter pachys]|uniref:Uncharacterized protein n=1 Tax=Diploscapter pachys TaxID=2018661 RepID=A0A2A2LC50_9BILA|nr:hypothetical protein WR25_24910 [Diploscapter pachys]
MNNLQIEEYYVIDNQIQCELQPGPSKLQDKACQKFYDGQEYLTIGQIITSLNLEAVSTLHVKDATCLVTTRGERLVQAVYDSFAKIKEILGDVAVLTPFNDVANFVSDVTGVSLDLVNHIIAQPRETPAPLYKRKAANADRTCKTEKKSRNSREASGSVEPEETQEDDDIPDIKLEFGEYPEQS